MNRQRRIAFLPQIIDFRAQQPQRIDKIANGPLVHARHAFEHVFAARKRACGGERTEGRAGVAEEEFGLLDRERAADTRDGVVVRIALPGYAHTERAQRVEHHAGVVGIEQRAHLRRAGSQRGEQQHAVGNALGAGQLHGAVRMACGRQIKKFGSGEFHQASCFFIQSSRASRAREKILVSVSASPADSAVRRVCSAAV